MIKERYLSIYLSFENTAEDFVLTEKHSITVFLYVSYITFR